MMVSIQIDCRYLYVYWRENKRLRPYLRI